MSTTTAPSPIRLRLRPGVRKLVLLLHIMSAGAWLGLDVAMAVAIFTGLNTDDPQLAAALFQALETITVLPLLTTGIVCLITGLFLGWGSKYGVVRYWWVLIKLILNLILTALVLVALRSGVQAVGAFGAVLAQDPTATADLQGIIYPPIVSPTALTIAMILAVFKPWSRIRKPRPH
ncbi:hypothetical protein [Microlunatus speluncae]|uniref:hypothetical protein n=1 Tax=Microlunatus speluncae TaxID=2594267 RepID=UPI0012666843|nr:hypothetical protein [Microlunatus speluncae]